MREDTGAQIRVSSKDALPGCVLPTDELVQISGDPQVVKRAMHEVSAQIYENPLRDRPRGSGSLIPSPGMPLGAPLFPTPGGFPPLGLPGVFYGYGQVDPIPPWFVNAPPPGLPPRGREEDFAIRLLCPDSRIGAVIGKAGHAIRLLREETGARIRVEESVPGVDERIVAISATEFFDDRSPVIEAALKLQVKMSDFGGDRERPITTRLLVLPKQIGCLLGKGGNVISEMRKKTTAGIKVLQKEDLPKCAQDTDELVQITGDENVARQALIEVLTRLRNNVFRDQFGEMGIPGHPPSPVYRMPPYGGSYSALPYNARSYNTPSMKGEYDASSSYANKPDTSYSGGTMYLSYNGFGQGVPYESSYSATPAFQGTGNAYGGITDMQSGPPHSSRPSGDGSAFGHFGDFPSKALSNKHVEVTIPSHSVPSVLGKGGTNLASIREISGANVRILEPNMTTGDQVAEIFGTPEQTQAAESLLQAFIYNG